jgi:tetratricopeptide (TPR) repeat protein
MRLLIAFVTICFLFAGWLIWHVFATGRNGQVHSRITAIEENSRQASQPAASRPNPPGSAPASRPIRRSPASTSAPASATTRIGDSIHWATEPKDKAIADFLAARDAWLADTGSASAFEDALKAAADMGWWGARIELLQRELELHAEDRDARAMLAGDLMRMSRWVEAIDPLKQLLSEREDDGRAWYNLATCHAALGHDSEALDCWQQAARFLPEDPDVAARCGQALLDANQNQRAVEILRPAHAADPGALDLAMNLALALERLEQYPEARTLLWDILEHDADNLPAMNRLARIDWALCLADTGGGGAFWKDAVEWCKRSLSIDSDQPEVRGLLESIAASPRR